MLTVLMGFLDRMLGRKPDVELARVLDRAEALLDAGRAYDALLLVRRADEGAERLGPSEATALRVRARELEVRAREVLIGSALAEADRAEAEEDYDEAADWVSAALENVARIDDLTAAARRAEDDGRPAALRRRRKDLQRRGRDAARQPSLLRRFEDDERPGPDPLGTEQAFGALVGILHEEVADLYLHRPLPFQKAYIDLNEGRAEASLAAFEGLVLEEPDDAVIRFERGRARLLSGDFAGAREDFEAVWDELGDDSLDYEGELSVPLLWSHATVETGDLATVADRLEPLADPATGDPTLVAMRAYAVREQRGDARIAEARELLEEAVRHQDHKLLPKVLAETYLVQGERELAMARLEAIVAPACSSGRCDSGRLDVEAARLLVDLYLEERDAAAAGSSPGRSASLERPAEILGAIAVTVGDLSGAVDRELVARYRRLAGTDDLPFPGAAGLSESELDEDDGHDPIEPS
jgi:tetratricopeptide (TPR) repeat protein